MTEFVRIAWVLWLIGSPVVIIPASVSAYSNDDCGKLPDHPEYGITRFGTVAGDSTVACPFDWAGTWVVIPGVGVRRCEDTGGAIELGWNGLPCIDVWMKRRADALRWGRRSVGVLIIPEGVR